MPHLLGGEDVVCPKCGCNLLVPERVIYAKNFKAESKMETKDAFPRFRCANCGEIAWSPMEIVKVKDEPESPVKP